MCKPLYADRLLQSIKPIIHALLVSGNLPSLSLSNNRKIRSQGWRLIAYYVRRSPYLKYLDASDNIIDKKIADLIGQAIARHHASSEKKFSQQALSTSPSTGTEGKASKEPSAAEEVAHPSEGSEEDEPDPFEYRRATLLQYDGSSTSGLSSLRLENCSLRNPVLDSLSNSIRQSRIKHVSLRRNHINQLGAVALAVLIRDYELSPSPFASATTTLSQHLSISDTTADQQSMRHVDAPKSDSDTLRPHSASTGNSVTASLHHLVSSEGTTSLQSFRPSTPDRNDALSPSSSSSHSVSDVDDHENSFGPERNRGRVSVPQREAVRYAEMRQRLQKQIEVLPRVGNLLTLDIRSNDIRVCNFCSGTVRTKLMHLKNRAESPTLPKF